MRFVKISQPEMEAIRQLYESVMSYACHGLFYHEGMSLGAAIAEEARSSGGDFFQTCRQVLADRGWVDDIRFEKSRVVARGSVEGSPGANTPTCHRLKGILAHLYEISLQRKVKFNESQCVSGGASECVFQLEE